MTGIDILEIRNPAALDLPEIVELFATACENDRPIPADVLIEELRDHLRLYHGNEILDEIGILVGKEDGRFAALAVLIAPASRLFPGVAVYHFCNTGTTPLREALISSVAEWSQSRGRDVLIGQNMTGRSDAAWKKAFGSAGRIRKIGTAFAIDLTEREDGR